MYQCSNPECGKVFMHTAKLTVLGMPIEELKTLKLFIEEAPKDPELAPLIEMFKGLQKAFDMATFERSVCPFCKSPTYKEYVEPQPEAEEVGNVYIYELTTGPQTELNKLLADGYKIVNRYAKSYALEKPKAKPTPKEAVSPSNIEIILDANSQPFTEETQA
jgi:hypothetical protein